MGYFGTCIDIDLQKKWIFEKWDFLSYYVLCTRYYWRNSVSDKMYKCRWIFTTLSGYILKLLFKYESFYLCTDCLHRWDCCDSNLLYFVFALTDKKESEYRLRSLAEWLWPSLSKIWDLSIFNKSVTSFYHERSLLRWRTILDTDFTNSVFPTSVCTFYP